MQATLIDPKILLKYTRRRISIDELVDALENEGVFSDEDEAALIIEHRKRVVRRAVKGVKDENGFPIIFSVYETISGCEVRVYKQLALFNVEDYRQAIEQCRERSGYWRKLERHLLKLAREKFGNQMEMFG